MCTILYPCFRHLLVTMITFCLDHLYLQQQRTLPHPRDHLYQLFQPYVGIPGWRPPVRTTQHREAAIIQLLILLRHHLYHTAKPKCRKLETNIPRKGISGPQSQFPHSCVCERIIYSHDGSAFSAGGNMWTDPVNV
jgi:hypothetical protein